MSMKVVEGYNNYDETLILWLHDQNGLSQF